MKRLFLAGLAGALLVATAQAQDEPTLGIGDPAPALQVAEWVKGAPISKFESGNVYLVEFWATWCAPCIAGMPHLSQLQRDYQDKNVTIIGLTSHDPRNTLEMVKKMVEEKGDGMAYTVAWDVEQKTDEAYMKAAKQRGIPTSFLVDKVGKIAWIGHPMNADIPLAYVVAGTWDYEKGPAMMKAINDDRRALYQAAATDPKKALELLVKFKNEYPLAAAGMEDLHFWILSRLPEHQAEAEKLGTMIVKKAIAAKDAPSLNSFAWSLVDPAVSLENRFLDLAMLAANKANEFTEKKDPATLDTVARVHFWRGDIAKALEIQKSAIKHADERMKGSLEEALHEYEKALKEKLPS